VLCPKCKREQTTNILKNKIDDNLISKIIFRLSLPMRRRKSKTINIDFTFFVFFSVKDGVLNVQRCNN